MYETLHEEAAITASPLRHQSTTNFRSYYFSKTFFPVERVWTCFCLSVFSEVKWMWEKVLCTHTHPRIAGLNLSSSIVAITLSREEWKLLFCLSLSLSLSLSISFFLPLSFSHFISLSFTHTHTLTLTHTLSHSLFLSLYFSLSFFLSIFLFLFATTWEAMRTKLHCKNLGKRTYSSLSIQWWAWVKVQLTSLLKFRQLYFFHCLVLPHLHLSWFLMCWIILYYYYYCDNLVLIFHACRQCL